MFWTAYRGGMLYFATKDETNPSFSCSKTRDTRLFFVRYQLPVAIFFAPRVQLCLFGVAARFAHSWSICSLKTELTVRNLRQLCSADFLPDNASFGIFVVQLLAVNGDQLALEFCRTCYRCLPGKSTWTLFKTAGCKQIRYPLTHIDRLNDWCIHSIRWKISKHNMYHQFIITI